MNLVKLKTYPNTSHNSRIHCWAYEELQDHFRMNIFIQVIPVLNFTPFHAFAAKDDFKAMAKVK